MTEHSVDRATLAGDPFAAAVGRTGSTRNHRADEAFLDLLAEDFGVDAYSLRKAFMGVPPAPKRQCIELCEWAQEHADGDPERMGALLRGWAKRRGVGAYDPRLLEAPPAS